MQMNCLKQGDCMALMKELSDRSVDMILCDLPYGNTRNGWDKCLQLDKLWGEYARIIKEHGAVVLFGNGRFTNELINTSTHSVPWRYNLVWYKTTPTGFLNAKRMPLRIHEDICVFYQKSPTYNPQMTHGNKRKISTASHKRKSKTSTNYGRYLPVSYNSTDRYPTSVLHFATDKQKSSLHPTQKPIALLEYLIRTYTDEGDVVLDNCMGSGSTGVACVNTDRSFIGYELDKDYFEIAENRVKEALLCR